MCRFRLFLLLALLTFLPTGALSQAEESGGDSSPQQDSNPLPATVKPETNAAPEAAGAADYSKEAAVIEQIHSRIRFENDGTGRRESVFRVRVQSEAGVQAWGQLRFGYNSANDRMEISYVRVIKPDGSVVKAGDDAVQDLTAPLQQLAPVYTDYREKHVTVPGLRPGDVLECESVTVMQTPVAVGQFWTQYDFNQSAIVLDEQLEIDVPGARSVKVKTRPGFEPKITEEKGRRIYHWTSSHLVREDGDKEKDKEKPIKKRKKTEEFPAVQLSTFGSWEEVGQWYAALEKDRRQPSKEVREQSEALTKGLKTDLEKIQALYDYVATNFRYVSLSLGMARYQPHAAAEVLHNQYGDCKDKHTLLASLLEAQGMHASTVLIHSSRKLDADVPSPAQFNHVITMLPLGKEKMWMDTTTEVAPFRLLAYPLRKKQSLVIPHSGVPHLEETPADSPVPNTSVIEVNGQVNESGTLEGKVTLTFRGDSELVFRTLVRRIPSTQLKTVMDQIDKKMGLGGSVSGVIVGDPAATHEPFTFAYDINKGNFLDFSKKKQEMRLPLSQFNPVPVKDEVDEVDEAVTGDAEPFKLGPPIERTYKIKLQLDPRFAAHIPVPMTVERDYGAYQSTYKLEGGIFTAERHFVTRLDELPVSRANDYRAFRRSVMADSNQFLSIENATAESHAPPVGMKVEELISSGNAARKEGNYTLAISLLNQAVVSAPKNRTAWNDLGLAYFDSREDALAINAFQKQIEVDPFHQFSYNNLGRVYLRQRKYEEAEKWFRKQIEVNPLDKYAHANLGLTFVEWHKYQEAIPELEQAASLTPNDPQPQVRLGEGYLNLGQDDKAMAAFDKALQISANPGVWNNIAYQLALKKSHLDVARRYAESAVTATAASLRNVSLEQLNRRDLGPAASLPNYWDTLGWVEFTEGNTDKALKYIFAAWQVSQRADEADHLGQIYQQRGDHAKAEYFYAMALNARRPEQETRERLSSLLGGDEKVDAVVEGHRNELLQLRTIKVPAVKDVTGTADFFLLLSAGHESKPVIESVQFAGGEEKLKDASALLRAATYSQSFPDDTPVKVLRRGTLTCKTSAPDCTLLLDLPEDVHSTD